MNYPIKPGVEAERLQLIWDIYQRLASSNVYSNFTYAVTWDMVQVFAAIAGGYQIKISKYYKGLQKLRKMEDLWPSISNFVKVGGGNNTLSHGKLFWEQLNDIKEDDNDTVS